MASNSSGGKGIIGTAFSLIVICAVIYGLYYAFGGNPEALGNAVVDLGTNIWDFITRLIRSGIDNARGA